MAFHAHKGQTRRGGNVPFIVHPIRVSKWFDDEMIKTACLLHDVVEDTFVTVDDIKYNISFEVGILVDTLTRRKGEKYFDYIERVSVGEDSSQIKIADIIDNLSDNPKPTTVPRYIKSLEFLLNKYEFTW